MPTIAAILLFFVAAVLFIRNRKAQNSQKPDEELNDIDEKFGVLNELVKKDLKVPEDAKELEIFTNMYFENDKEDRQKYTGDTAYVFEEDGKLCFWYGSVVLGILVSRIEAVVKVNEKVKFDCWIKDEPYDSGEYAQYSITKNTEDKYEEYYSMTGYYSLRFLHFGTSFEVIIPLYSIEPVLDILKLEIVEE